MDRRFVPGDDAFFLKVTGNSMVGCGIVDGDYVMIQRSREAQDGEIVAARVGDEATVKQYRQRDGHIELAPANPEERAIVVQPGDDFAILGKVCGVFRPFQELQSTGNELAG
jgi:repressor LexA